MNRIEKGCAVAIAIALVMILGVSFARMDVELTWAGAWAMVIIIASVTYKRNHIETEEDIA